MADHLEMRFAEPEAGSADETIEIDANADLSRLGIKAETPNDKDEDLPEEYRGLTRKQIVEKTKANAVRPDPTDALSKGLSDLASALKKPDADDVESTGAEPEPRETDAEYYKRVGDSLFDSEKVGTVFPESVVRAVAPIFAQTNTYAMGMAKKLLRLDPESGPVFKRYETEIEREAKKLVKLHGPDPRVYDVAFETIKRNHAPEMETERVTKTVEEQVALRVKEELKKHGIGDDGDNGAAPTAKPAGFRALPGGSSVAAGPSGKKTLRITPEIRRAAERKGLSVEKYVEVMTNG